MNLGYFRGVAQTVILLIGNGTNMPIRADLHVNMNKSRWSRWSLRREWDRRTEGLSCGCETIRAVCQRVPRCVAALCSIFSTRLTVRSAARTAASLCSAALSAACAARSAAASMRATSASVKPPVDGC